MAENIENGTEIVEEGQFDDAPEDTQESAEILNPREGHAFIDEEDILNWSSNSDADEDDSYGEPDDSFAAQEDDLEAAAFETLRAEDEDWEIAERDFTKHYNRLKQHVAVRTGAAQGVASATNARAAVAALPAVNRPRQNGSQGTAGPSASASASGTATATASAQHAKDKTAGQLQALSKYSSRLRNIDMPYDLAVGVNRKGPSATANMKDKSDRATNEQVLDPRTRIILFKMIGRGLIFEVNGCVSTGKEANVYHALTSDQKHLALKIYKTSILVFKDRDKYVTGEFRFRRGYSRHNPRKMVRLWAEKEMRNLKRLRAAGILCPEPVEVRENVLVMGFVGDKEGWASPRLKDAQIPESAAPDLYVELLLMTRKMFQECKLVHADLSEYNILYHTEAPSPEVNSASPPASDPQTQTESDTAQEAGTAHDPEQKLRGHLYIIDVSQSVEHDHPHAFDFLRADLRNVEEFFSRRGVHTVGLRRAFEFVTTETLTTEEAPLLRTWMDQPEPEVAAANTAEATRQTADEEAGEARLVDAAHEDSVFLRSYIPRTLNEVYDPERDVGALSRGEGASLIYKNTIGLVTPTEDKSSDPHPSQKKGVWFDEEAGEEPEESDQSEEGSEGETGEDESGSEEGKDANGQHEERRPRGHRHEDKEAKKERKKAVKAEARERRKHKIPKAEKKRKVKATARGG